MELTFIIRLLEMSINTYHIEDLPNVIFKYGYNGDGVRCKIYNFRKYIVMAIKGTSLNIMGYELDDTAGKDKKLVNTIFNKCKFPSFNCAYNKKLIFDKLGYLQELQRVLICIQTLYPEKEIILTGHSLGGTLASLLNLIYKYKCITFSSPGDLYISKILQLHSNSTENKNSIHYGMCNDVIFTGRCDKLCKILGYNVNTSRHNGKVYCLKIHPNVKSVIFHNSSVLLSYFKKLASIKLF